jgi:hypothetical protein
MLPRAITPAPQARAKTYTIATLVTKPGQYRGMVASFQAGGFDGGDCEFLYLDNTGGNALSAYQGLNRLLDEADGARVILCHQDVKLLQDGRAALDARLAELETKSPHWGLAGNAGGIGPGRLALRLTDPHGRDVHTGDLPVQVQSLDENFIVVRRAARLSFSRDLDGFHFYGTDLCLQAELAGWTAHVIDFHLEHLSGGLKSPDFYQCERNFRQKYARAFRSRWLQTTCALISISSSPMLNLLGGAAALPYTKLVRRLPGARGWANQRLTTAPAGSKV